MNDPHVETLYYNLRPSEETSYDSPPKVAVVQPAFDALLDGGRITIRMTQHFPTEDEAKSSVDAFFKAWEISSSLQNGREEFKFEYDHCDIIDRSPAPAESTKDLSLVMTAKLGISGSATVVRVRKAYSKPLPAFSITPLVNMLWNRYKRYLQGSEPLFSMAYFCLSALEKGSGGRKKAAARYHVDVAVLNTIGNIASTKGSAIDARRMPKTGLIPPTGNELEWLKATVRQIILQVGIVEGGDKPARIAMRTLPKL